MAASQPHAKFAMQLESPPQSSNRTAWEKQAEDAKITFDKIVDGHYHGKSGYKKVACLLITWKDDDMKCKETEVDALHKIFAEDFHFETEFFQIPSEKWETALNTKVANFIYEYDSPDNMVIVYYAGHGYVGKETKQFKLAAKASADRDGDPTAFFDDVLSNLRLACCDQLLILDCCYAEKAFTREHEGKSKFELLTSVGPEVEGLPPGRAGSFTAALNKVLRKLLLQNQKGFSTSQLYRELYHTLPATVERPHLFDLAKNTQERIWLRPLKITQLPETEGDIFLNVTIRLKVDEDTAEQRENLNVVMNRLAYKLQYLQDVDQISFKYLSAPKARLEEFRRIVLIRQKWLPLLERIRLRLRGKELKKICKKRANKQMENPPTNAVKMFLENSEQRRKDRINDWSGSELDLKPTRKVWLPWPEGTTWTRYMTFGFFSLKYKLDIPKDFSYFSIILLSANRLVELMGGILFAGVLLALLFSVVG